MSVVSLPLWAVFAVSFGSPLLSFAGVIFAQWFGRRSAQELETRSRREETMRTLRWAAELAVSDDPPRAGLGITQLQALGASEMLDDDQGLFVDAALAAVYADVDAVVSSRSGSVFLGQGAHEEGVSRSRPVESSREAKE